MNITGNPRFAAARYHQDAHYDGVEEHPELHDWLRRVYAFSPTWTLDWQHAADERSPRV